MQQKFTYDPAAGGCGLTLMGEVPTVTREGQVCLAPEGYLLFALSPAPAPEEELTIRLTYYDDTANYAHIHYPNPGGGRWPRSLHIDRMGDGGFVTVAFPVTGADLSLTLPESGANLALTPLTLRELTIEVCEQEALPPPPAFAPETAENGLIGKGVAGYQVWFRAGADRKNWFHWGGWQEDRFHPKHELYPYMKEYADEVTLRPTGQADLGDGTPAGLFTSCEEGVIDTHLRWMREYGIDGAAVQRFYSCISPGRTTGRTSLATIRDKAEKYHRLFYVMYDFSGCGRLPKEEFLRNVQRDFIFNAEETGVVSSPAYAHAGGRPAVCFWGLSGQEDHYVHGETASALIDWFHRRGYYVIVGTPDNHYTEREGEMLAPFAAADMISPWTVGRYGPPSVKEWLERQAPKDIAFCAAHGVVYQPVLFAGFAWTNMGNMGGINHIPHLAGQFLWDQAYELVKRGANTLYFAMFDEYDEGTAIMKGARDWFDIPTDQYYLTYAADGLWLSEDFYLRAAGAAIRMAKGTDPLREQIDIPHALGPIFWRNGFESRETVYRANDDARLTGVGKLDVCLYKEGPLFGHIREATITNAAANSGLSSFRFAGSKDAAFQLAEVKIAADKPLKVSFSLLAEDEGGKTLSVALMTKGGLTEKTAPVKTTGTWERVTIPMGVCEPIVGVAAVRRGDGDFSAYIDDIVIEEDV